MLNPAKRLLKPAKLPEFIGDQALYLLFWTRLAGLCYLPCPTHTPRVHILHKGPNSRINGEQPLVTYFGLSRPRPAASIEYPKGLNGVALRR